MEPAYLAAHRDAYDAVADEYVARTERLRPVTQACVDLLAPRLPANGRVLDVGCGAGLMVQLLRAAGFDAEGIDLAPRMAAASRVLNPTATIHVGDVLSYPFTGAYAGLTALAFIHLFPKADALDALRTMRGLLEQDGLLYIGTTKASRSSEGWEDKADYASSARRYRKHWTETEFLQALKETGFTVLDLHLLTDPFGKTWMDVIARKAP